MTRRDQQHQWNRPGHGQGYNPRAPGLPWHGAASTSAPAPGAAAAQGMNPYSYAPFPQFAPNPFNEVFSNLLLQNPSALTVFHQFQQQQQQQHVQHYPSHFYQQNPAPSIQHPPAKPSAVSSTAPPPPQPQQQQQPKLQPQPQPQNQQGAIAKAHAAARKAQDELLKSGEGVTGWRLAQAVLVALKADSWDSLGIQLHQVPLLHEIFLIEGKVNTLIHCYVAARRIVTVYDLEAEVCKNEGIGKFEELGLGPFLQHPLVVHYFSAAADSSMVPKLSSEEIIIFLQKFVDKSQKKITLEEFLDYLVEQLSVSGKEKLGVRVQSLGLHISLLRQARRAEVDAVKLVGKMSGFGDSSQEKNLSKKSTIRTDKQALEKRFNSIANRIKQLPGINEHIHFISSDDEIDGDSGSEDDKLDGNESKNDSSVLDNKDGDKRASSCPYPSKTEEMERLGLKSETCKRPALESSKVRERGKKGNSREKRKVEENGSPSSLCDRPKKQQKMQTQKHEVSPNCFLSISKLENFITTWKETCREHPVQQVLEMIANYYARTPKEKKKIINFCVQYPGIGLFNVAVKSIACGLLDSIYDAIQLSGENNVSSSLIPNTTTEVMEIEPPSSENTKCIAKEAGDSSKNNGNRHSVAIDDIVRRISEHIESNFKVLGDGALQVRILRDCETWVTTQFSAKQFSDLGHGAFLDFLEKHAHQFSPTLSGFLKGSGSDSLSLEVSVLQQQIEVLFCQAERNWLEDGHVSEDGFLTLLKRQFPTISFGTVPGKSAERLAACIERHRKNIQTNNIKFSISLLEKRWSGILPVRHDNVDGLASDVQQSYYSGTICSREAINCLLKAPMLSDLLLWSHWDLLFAPSLGSFIPWLLNTGPIKDLSCIVTIDARFIRVDPSVTVDQFLEAIIQRSPFQVAVKLLSLLYIYDGSTNTPTSLLKCYAQRAMNVIVDNSNGLMNSASESKLFMCEEPDNASSMQSIHSTHFGSDSLSSIHDTARLVAKFILDCLGHLPSEFRSLAADILLAGLRIVTKNCYSVMLHEATEDWQLCMLHDIGLSLGVAEWVEDCHRYCLTEEAYAKTELHSSSKHTSATSDGATCEKSGILISNNADMLNDKRKSSSGTNDQAIAADSRDHKVLNPAGIEADTAELYDTNKSSVMGETILEEATLVIETIRHEEFGLDHALSYTENSLLEKQHARLGRALHCLSQELYSQDSHLLLELVQNADDNTYPEDVEPTLAFILQENGIVVLNNERGFSAENIRALCDIGNSTKKGSNMGYIGNKGIGFKSVFRVTDTPEIHSNGFHVKFDITEGQIGFVLPTVVPPYNTSPLSRMLCFEEDKCASSLWNTSILLPFRSKFREGTGMCSIVSMFSDLHPSLLLFLHRLKCVKFKNLLNDTLLVMRRESLCDGIVRISHENEIMSWLVVSKKLHGTVVRHDVCTTEISVAFTLQETEKGDYESYLKQQPVFAFLPLRNYGLKFILQGDFVLPSSREEVDADSAWNQWLLSEFPSLFVSAQESFCALPCFQTSPGKAVTTFLSFIPLVGDVHGFFSQLPHLILSKLRLTRCMFLDGSSLQWVYPCNTLRGWDQQTKMLLSDDLLHGHVGLGYLSKDIVISDKLSRVLGIHEYGPKILMDAISSICRTDGCIESLGLEWLCAWFVTLYLALLSHSSRNFTLTTSSEDDLLNTIRKIPCIPLSDGSLSSVSDGPIWLPFDIVSSITESRSSIQNFSVLYGNLRTVSPDLLSASCKNKYLIEEVRTNDLVDILLKIGVRKLSGHDIIKNHIMMSLRNGIDGTMADKTMIEYVSFIMLHFQSSCTSCNFEKEEIVAELRKMSIFLTNHGYKCPADEPIHFSKDYGNSVDVGRLLRNVDFDWIELDSAYLTNHCSDSSLFEMKKWRQFFEEMGVTDFVQVVKVEKNMLQADSFLARGHSQGDASGKPCSVVDWESSELASILSIFSSKRCRENCIYLLEVLDKLWDDYYSVKTRSLTNATHYVENTMVESSFLKCIRSFKWIASSMDEDLHNATDLFYDFENVRSLLGSVAPYAVPQVSSYSIKKDIGFKTEVSHRDAFMVLKSWITSQVPFSASMNQMCKFYSFMSEGVVDLKIDMKREFLSCSYIFTPLQRPQSREVIPGKFSPPEDLYWHDPTGCSELTEELISIKKTRTMFPRRMLSVSYPSLCEFFTEACGVPKTPTTSNYIEILLRLSNFALPSQVANHVFHVFVRWANDLNPETDKMNDMLYLKESLQKLETKILPTSADKWVSLHPSFGLVCWVDDDQLKQQFEGSSDVDFIQFGDLSSEDKRVLHGRVAALMKSLGIPALSKVMYREAIFYGTVDNRAKADSICELLPYMQRYIYKMHRDTYTNFQKNEITKLSALQVVVVDKLFYKYVLRGLESSSKKRFDCHCLLQENTLYATHGADSHSMCLELSRIFFDGSPDLHFANFLHMIKTMAGSGTSPEQLESFISNNQNVPELPEQEAVWSFSALSAAHQVSDSQIVEVRSACELNIPNHQRTPGTVSSWPPNNWKTAPDFRTYQKSHHAYMPDAKVNGAGTSSDLTMRECEHTEDTLVPVDIEGDWIIEANTMTENTLLADSTAANLDEPQMMSLDPSSAPIYLDLEAGSSSPTVDVEVANFNEKLAGVPEESTDTGTPDASQLRTGTPDASQLRTGRLGEALVHKYFAEQLGSNNVRWVNQETETGLPYDIVVTRKGNFREYVEVKATVSSKKDWFYVTSREWQFALEEGDSFSIARVALSGTKKASIEMLKNPYKLYQQKALKLALLISR